jgi:uncharacterized protein YgbK (DUF1537 family)
LPSLDRPDKQRLLVAKSLFTWSGRYAAPRTDQKFKHERREQEQGSGSGKLAGVSLDELDFGVAGGARSRAVTTAVGLRSMAITVQVGPTISAASNATSPTP